MTVAEFAIVLNLCQKYLCSVTLKHYLAVVSTLFSQEQ